MAYKFILFLILNFGALAIGGFFTGSEVSSDWYTELNKAPWTPPGWVFGVAWTTIMVFFTFYMTYAVKDTKKLSLLISLFAVQWLLNVSWNPIFFYFHQVLFGLLVITSLTILIAVLLYKYWSELRLKSLLILPYLIWLVIATSLNAYIFIQN
jgi:tryptophan-rich sensory protein